MKHLGSIFTIILLLTVGNVYAFSDSFTVGGVTYYYRNYDDGYNYLKVYVSSVDKGSTGNLVIPSSVTYMYTTYEVIRISANAFSDCTGLTSVQIPYSVTYIGENAFSGCTGLKSIEIPEGVTYIGRNTFSGCTELTNITVSDYNKVYDSRDNCNAIIETATNTLIAGCKNTVIPTSVTSIGGYAFSGLTNITIPKHITSIGAGAFSGCPDLTSIIVEDGNSVYDSRDNCNAIIKTATNTIVVGCKNTIIPNSVTSIGRYAFEGCTGLTSVSIPNGVTSIGGHAFYGCSGITNITIPNNVTSIGEYAFGGCTNLTAVTIPGCVESLGAYAFYKCTNLKRVVIPSSVSIINEYVFAGCSLKDMFVISSKPLAINENFYGRYISHSNINLHIPYGSLSAYKSTAVWNEFENYIEINQPNNPTHQSITLYMPDLTGPISRWEYSRDGGATWTNIECEEYCYTETDPEPGKVLYRVLKSDGVYSNILTINYYDPVPEVIATTPTSETKTVDESITFALNVKDDGYTYQWMFNNVAIEGATNNTYSIPAINMTDAGEYFCVVSNPVSCVNSTSSKLTVNKCPQIITFPEIETKTFGDEAFTLPATTDKGLTINYQSTNTNVATVEGNIVTIKEPGETNIIATQAGNDDYLEAAYVSRKLTVKKVSQTIVLNELQDKTFEDIPFMLPATTDKGLTISYQSTNTNVATIEGNAVIIVGAGTTDIIATQQGDEHHYAATPVSRTLTVNRQTQSITFNAFGNVVYGDAQIELNQYTNKNFEITYTSSNTDVATVDGNIISVIKPGVTVIKAIQNGNKNYLPAQSIERTLIVNKAEQKIEWYELPAKKYGDDDFALPKTTDKGLTISYTSDNEDVATINGNIVSIKNAGSTNITATQSGDDYYNAATAVTQILTASKITQSITFEELPVMTFGDTPIELNATASSSNEVVFESSDETIATISGKTLTVVGAGSCIITASCAGDNNYYTAIPVERVLVVNKARQTITIAPVNGKRYGDEPFELNVTTNNNRPVVLTSSDASVLSIKGTTATIRGAGNVTITALQEATDEYEKAETQISIVVGKAILTASVSNAERVYGEENPNFKITYSGFVNNETKEDLEMTPVATCRATRYSNVGEYDITISSFTDKNYVLDAKKAKLVIKKALITVSPYDVTKVYGEKNPALQITYSGFKNNENESILLSKAVAFTKVKTMSNAGEYAITTEGANAVNYEFEYKESIFTVSKAPLVITAEDKNINYMEEIPMFTILYDGFVGNDSEADLDELPRISCDATNEAKPGTYEIVLSGGYDNNYEYTLINGTMVIIDTTGINAIELDLENNLVYDLNGLRITETENLTRGIYIINGRKVFVK